MAIEVFCIYPCISIELMRKYDISAYIGLPITSLIMTLAEWYGLLIGRVVYYNHWNIIAAYFSYVISLLISYIFYKILRKENLI